MKKKVLSEVQAALSQLTNLEDKVEVLAQVFIIEGVNLMAHSSELPDKITPLNVVRTILDHKEEHGDTLGNSLARQGLVLLSWLDV